MEHLVMSEQRCTIDGCHRAHYRRWRNTGDVRAHVPLRAAGPCSVDGCDRQRYARQLCNTHCRRLLATGDARPDDPIRIVTGEGTLSHGYWKIPVAVEERWLSAVSRMPWSIAS
jgi:hypothetical protein